ncbi:MAG: lipid IV(A) 3-deoxy-D-manno-octulosonic acid transferase [Gammaproteobacteria bacterium]|nr:lipid IV(A) 3-deoxy-D-manno-octulosonic acid transferase [Gammaproteobacteria bacterium]
MVRFIYAIVSRLSLPVFLCYLIYRSIKEKEYRARKRERFGFVSSEIKTGSLWFHTVSAGEAIAAIPIIEAILQNRPSEHVLATTTTPTGYEAIEKSFGSRIDLCYVPYDVPSCVNRFLKRTQPKALLLMETELWPNLVNFTARRDTPIFLLNARLSAKSASGYARMSDLTESMLKNVRMVASQYPDTAERFQTLGLPKDRVVVTGNVKFDLNDQIARLPEELQELETLQERGTLVWIAGSTHHPEEEVVLDAHRAILDQSSNTRLILAPRHVKRAAEILTLCESRGIRACLLNDLDHNAEVIVVDRMGILFPLYQCASVAFVGGSLQQTGGHNPIEPAFFGLPILMGPSRHNFAEVCSRFTARDCLFTVNDAVDIAENVLHFHRDSAARARCFESTRAVVQENQGALERVCTLVNSWLD